MKLRTAVRSLNFTPFTLSSSATAKKELSSSCATFTSPWYMKLRTAVRSLNFTPFRYKRGWAWGLRLSTPLKKGEQAERMTLWAWICSSSQDRVTSKKSLSSLNSRKAVEMLDSKSFHRRQNFSEAIFRLVLLKVF